MQQAIAEIEDLVRSRYPAATFEVVEGSDPVGTYVWAAVDVPDPDVVMDVVVDRLLELQIEDSLPLYLVPTRPAERIAEALRAQRNRAGGVRGRAALRS